jgi:hypothetical protein
MRISYKNVLHVMPKPERKNCLGVVSGIHALSSWAKLRMHHMNDGFFMDKF